ncbi:MAG: hypothetical protein KC656_32455, partial [Myxococcales bacterium]|nr:hypothetical protein [Myxococcales bacterium]
MSMFSATFHDFVVRDVTSDAEVAADLLRSPAVEAVLAAAGWQEIGVHALGNDLLMAPETHALVAQEHEAVWRSPDGGTAACVKRWYGVDLVSFLTLFEDGAIFRSQWRSRDGGVSGMWFLADPRGEPPAQHAKARAVDADKPMSHYPHVDQVERLWTSGDVAEAVADHLAWVEAGAVDHGPPVPADLEVVGAVIRRNIDLMLSAPLGPRGLALSALCAVVLPIPALVLLEPWSGTEGTVAAVGVACVAGAATLVGSGLGSLAAITGGRSLGVGLGMAGVGMLGLRRL